MYSASKITTTSYVLSPTTLLSGGSGGVQLPVILQEQAGGWKEAHRWSSLGKLAWGQKQTLRWNLICGVIAAWRRTAGIIGKGWRVSWRVGWWLGWWLGWWFGDASIIAYENAKIISKIKSVNYSSVEFGKEFWISFLSFFNSITNSIWCKKGHVEAL